MSRSRLLFVTLAVLAFVVVGMALLIRFWPHEPLAENVTADRIVVTKSERTLSLMEGDTILRAYPIVLGGDPVGHKVQEGDGRTPEGLYRIDSRNEGSSFYRSLHISYPDADDRARAEAKGVSPGGDIVIHGIRNGFGWIGRLHRVADWTEGCIALTDEEMIEIWHAVPDGTPIEIRP